MPPNDIPHAQVDSPIDNDPAQPPVCCLDLNLRPDGWTDSIRLSGCTFAEVVHLCACSVWKQRADTMEREFLANLLFESSGTSPSKRWN